MQSRLTVCILTYSYKRRRLDGYPSLASSAAIFPSTALCMRAIAARICVALASVPGAVPVPGARLASRPAIPHVPSR